METPSHKKVGALPAQQIEAMADAGCITGLDRKNIRPSSLDLSISDEIYEVEGIFQPNANETVREVLHSIQHKKISLDQPLLEGKMYVVRINEKLDLPESVYAFCNPKSTSGRIDVHVRLIADRVSRYDTVAPAGWSGELWISVAPKSFPIKLTTGQTLNQLRFFNADTRFSPLDLELAMKQYELVWDPETDKALLYKDLGINDNDGSVVLTLNLNDDVLGYEGLKTDKVLDLSNIKHYEPSDFFKPIEKKGDYVYLKKGSFYILSTYESVRIPPNLASEMVSMDERSGEFRSHYAGFLDPGWGWGKDGDGHGRPFTLEVRPFEDIIVRHRQPVAKIRFEHLSELPTFSYDSIDSNYTKQARPKLSKHFKD